MKIMNLKGKIAIYISITVNYGDYVEYYEALQYGAPEEFEENEESWEEMARGIISSFSPMQWVGYKAIITPLMEKYISLTIEE